ncbi:hypothetical protein MMC06_002612 [Schaereria dolodes]|nr:hypothetical protein [Schaereria dolodes]
MVSARGGGLPTEKAKDVQERLRRERLLRAQPSGQGMEIAGLERGGGIREDGSQVRSSLATSTGGENDDVDNEQSAEGRGIVGMAKKAWLGGEGEDWKEKRLREEKEALETGKGYSGLIIDQIWDVWNGGKVDNERNEGNEETRPKDEEKDGS